MQKSNLTIEVWKDNLKKFDFIHDHEGFECDSCGLTPETIYVCWFKDFDKGRFYLRYKCFNCLEKLKKTEGYLQNYFELLAVEFKSSFPDIQASEILFIGKHFIMTRQNECVKKV